MTQTTLSTMYTLPAAPNGWCRADELQVCECGETFYTMPPLTGFEIEYAQAMRDLGEPAPSGLCPGCTRMHVVQTANDDRSVPRSELTIQRRFARFHKEHPEVMAMLIDLAHQAKYTHGKKQLGIKLLWDKMRWYMEVERDDEELFKLCNDYHSRYARLMMTEYPDLKGFFKTRKLRTA